MVLLVIFSLALWRAAVLGVELIPISAAQNSWAAFHVNTTESRAVLRFEDVLIPNATIDNQHLTWRISRDRGSLFVGQRREAKPHRDTCGKRRQIAGGIVPRAIPQGHFTSQVLFGRDVADIYYLSTRTREWIQRWSLSRVDQVYHNDDKLRHRAYGINPANNLQTVRQHVRPQILLGHGYLITAYSRINNCCDCDSEREGYHSSISSFQTEEPSWPNTLEYLGEYGLMICGLILAFNGWGHVIFARQGDVTVLLDICVFVGGLALFIWGFSLRWL
jgi:hypothetical protein